MKKILYCTLAAATLTGITSCSSDDPALPGGDGVYITVKLPSSFNTRGAFGDGAETGDRAVLNNLQWSVFEIVDGTPTLVFSDQKAAFGGSQTQETVNIPLAKGKTYQVAFYADDSSNNFVTYTDGDITVNYTNGASNTAAEDAFIGKSDIFTVSGGYSEEVTLTRPFAQLNWGTDDMDAKVLEGIIDKLTASVKVTDGLFTNMNVISGQLSNPASSSIEFAPVAFDNLPTQTFPVTGDPAYKLIAMNYLLAGDGVIDCELTLNEGLSSVIVNAAPVKVNHRTNIYGSLLTAPADFNIFVDNNFDDPDNDIYYTVAKTAEEFVNGIKKGGQVAVPASATIDLSAVLGDGAENLLTITEPTIIKVDGKLTTTQRGQIAVNGPLTIEGNGTIEGNQRGIFYVGEGGTLNAKDVTFNSPKAYRGGDVWNQGGGSMTFTNVTFNSNMASVYFQPAGNDDTLTMTGCTVNNTSNNSIVNPESNSRTYSYALRIQGGKAVLSDMNVTGIQGAVAVGQGAFCDIKSGTYTIKNSAPDKNDGFYCVYVATDGTCNIYDGSFDSVRTTVYNGNEDNPDYHYGLAVNLYGGRYSSKGVNQSGKSFTLPDGYEYKALEDQAPYLWEVVKK